MGRRVGIKSTPPRQGLDKAVEPRDQDEWGHKRMQVGHHRQGQTPLGRAARQKYICALTGPARLARHGVDRILAGSSGLMPGGGRMNLTLRRAGPSHGS